MADTRQKTPPAHFTEREAAEIIREASAHALASREPARTLTREEVLAMAREMGLSEAAVEVALVARAQKEQNQHKDRKELLDLATHGLTYTIVMGGLTLIDLFSGPGWWVHWPALGWGIGLALHAMATVMEMAKRGLKVEDDP